MAYKNMRPYTRAELRFGRRKEVEPSYPDPKHRLYIPPRQWRAMVQSGVIEIPDGPWHIADHPNRMKPSVQHLIDPIVTAENPMSEAQVDRWRERGLLVDSLGRPLHPRAPQLLTARGVGMFTGPGFNYHYGPAEIGNLGARNVIAGVPHYAMTLVQRGNNRVWGLPGGYGDRGETGIKIALREAWEEANIELSETDLASLDQRAVRIPPGGFYRATAHSWLDERFYFLWGRKTVNVLGGLVLGANDAAEVLDVRWMGMPEIETNPDVMKDHRNAVLEHEQHLAQLGV